MWSRDKLAELVEKRRQGLAQLPKAEEAMLAYARSQGMTAEDDVDRHAAKQTLDDICDAAEPEEWGRLKELLGNYDDDLIKGLMHYALTRSLAQLKEQQRGLEPEPGNAPEGEGRNRRRTRSRSR